MMKCPSCNQRKGKRPCPALRANICSNCCGTKQIKEIACPPDCGYLVTGREYREGRHYRHLFQGSDAELFEKVLTELYYPLRALQRILAETQRNFRGFDDRTALEAVQKVLETCETESRGVIFEQRSQDIQAQAAIQDLMKEIASLRQGQAERPEVRSIKLSEVILCLRFLEKDLIAMGQENDGPTAYMDYLASSFPESPRQAPSIIIP
jgi:hypothetical protein